MAEFQTFHCTFTVSRIRASSLARADLLRPPTRKESQDQRKLHNHQPAAVFHLGFRVESPWVLLRESRCCARERTAVSRTLSAPGAEFHQNVGLCTGNRLCRYHHVQFVNDVPEDGRFIHRNTVLTPGQLESAPVEPRRVSILVLPE